MSMNGKGAVPAEGARVTYPPVLSPGRDKKPLRRYSTCSEGTARLSAGFFVSLV